MNTKILRTNEVLDLHNTIIVILPIDQKSLHHFSRNSVIFSLILEKIWYTIIRNTR